jgi:ribosomal protein L13
MMSDIFRRGPRVQDGREATVYTASSLAITSCSSKQIHATHSSVTPGGKKKLKKTQPLHAGTPKSEKLSTSES